MIDFGVGYTEMFVIAVVAIIVIGPKELPSVLQYLLISQLEPHLTLFTRLGNTWQRQDFSDLQGCVPLVSIHCELNLQDVYEGVEF